MVPPYAVRCRSTIQSINTVGRLSTTAAGIILFYCRPPPKVTRTRRPHQTRPAAAAFVCVSAEAPHAINQSSFLPVYYSEENMLAGLLEKVLKYAR